MFDFTEKKPKQHKIQEKRDIHNYLEAETNKPNSLMDSQTAGYVG